MSANSFSSSSSSSVNKFSLEEGSSQNCVGTVPRVLSLYDSNTVCSTILSVERCSLGNTSLHRSEMIPPLDWTHWQNWRRMRRKNWWNPPPINRFLTLCPSLYPTDTGWEKTCQKLTGKWIWEYMNRCRWENTSRQWRPDTYYISIYVASLSDWLAWWMDRWMYRKLAG